MNADELVAEIETDKTSVEVPAPFSGTIVDLLVADGEKVVAKQKLYKLQKGEGSGAAAASKSENKEPEPKKEDKPEPKKDEKPAPARPQQQSRSDTSPPKQPEIKSPPTEKGTSSRKSILFAICKIKSYLF